MPVRQRAHFLPIPLRLLLTAQPKLLTPVLQVVHPVITRHLRGQAGRNVEGADEAYSGAVTLIKRFGSAANLNIHLHRLVLDDLYRRCTDGAPEFVKLPAPTDKVLQAQLRTIIARTIKLLTRPELASERVQTHTIIACAWRPAPGSQSEVPGGQPTQSIPRRTTGRSYTRASASVRNRSDWPGVRYGSERSPSCPWRG